MYLVVYDIENDRLRTRFSNFLKRFGIRVQFSVFEIENSQRILDNIRIEIKEKFKDKFGQSDSVLVFKVPDNACVAKFGYPLDNETDLVIR